MQPKRIAISKSILDEISITISLTVVKKYGSKYYNTSVLTILCWDNTVTGWILIFHQRARNKCMSIRQFFNST